MAWERFPQMGCFDIRLSRGELAAFEVSISSKPPRPPTVRSRVKLLASKRHASQRRAYQRRRAGCGPRGRRQALFEDQRQIRSALGHLENNGLSVISPLALRAGQLEHLLQAALPLATRKTFATYFHREFQLFADRI